MSRTNANDERTPGERMAEEDMVRERLDESGNRWRKVYFGGGSHFRNWLGQVIELRGQDNVEVEEVDPAGFQCFADSGEKLYRIWVREGDNEEVS